MNTRSSANELSAITEQNRAFVVEWLRDRSSFHSWFSSLVTGSFVFITVFGSKPSFTSVGGCILSVALILLLFALLCNLVCVWSIPSWKYRVSTGHRHGRTYDAARIGAHRLVGGDCVRQWAHSRRRGKLRHMKPRPNSSIERTSQRPFRALCATAHVER